MNRNFDQSYNSQNEILSRKSVLSQNYNENTFPPQSNREVNDQNQFKVSKNSSFQFFSVQKEKREALQAEIERQRRMCYSEPTHPRIAVYDENNNNIKITHIKHQAKVQQQLDSCYDSQSKQLVADTSYQRINYPDKHSSVNSSMQSESIKNQITGPKKGILKNSLSQQSANQEMRSQNNNYLSSPISNSNSDSSYSESTTKTQDILRKFGNSPSRIIWELTKTILLIFFLLVSLYFVISSVHQISLQNEKRHAKRRSNLNELENKLKLAQQELNEDFFHTSPNFDGLFEQKIVQQLSKKGMYYYNKFLDQLKAQEEKNLYRNILIAELIAEEPNNYQEIFSEVQTIRQQKGEIVEMTKDGFLLWVLK